MTEVPLRLPTPLPTDAGSLSRLIALLEFRHLDGLAEPFARPEPALAIASNLNYFVLGGSSKRAGIAPLSIPTPLLMGVRGQAVAVAFLVEFDGDRVRVSLGLPDGRGDAVAKSLVTMLGGPAPVPLKKGRVSSAPFAGCLFGIPRPSRDPARGGALDPLLDGLRGIRFSYLVVATSEPQEVTDESLAQLTTTAKALERSHLISAPGAGGDRVAARASQMLDEAVERLYGGRSAGLWRTSLLVFADDPQHVLQALSLLSAGLSGEDGPAPRIYRCAAAWEGYSVHSNVLLSEELASAFCLPVRDRSGFSVGERVEFDVDHPSSDGIVLGEILDGDAPSGAKFSVPTRLLCRHALVAGHTGSGKSTTIRTLLAAMTSLDKGFLVLDPVKPVEREYRALIAANPKLLVFRIGAPFKTGDLPFRLNPFYFPKGFSLFSHIDYLKASFAAAFGLTPPAPYLLESAIYRIYARRGWDMASGAHEAPDDLLSFPTLTQLYDEIEDVVDDAGYGAEVTRNLKGALKTRVGSLRMGPRGMCLDTVENTPEVLLFGGPVVLELMGLGAQEEQAFFMGLVLSRMMEWRQVGGLSPNDELRHLLVVEEAHRLLKSVNQRSSEDGNMAYQAVQTFANMIAEVRGYGQGVLLAEQLPSLLCAEVVKQVGLRLVHRLTPREDRDAVGDSMVLSEEQKRALATLRTGEAVAHMEGMDGAVKLGVAGLSSGATTSVDWFKRIRDRASPQIYGRMAVAMARAELRPWLLRADIQNAADDFLMACVADSPTLPEKLRFQTKVNAVVASMAIGLPVAEPELHQRALEDALLRRALEHRWRMHEWEGGCRELETRTEPYLLGLKNTFTTTTGPHAWCSDCPAPCLFRYDGSVGGREPGFKTEVMRVYTSGSPSGGVELVSAVQRLVKAKRPSLRTKVRAFGYCAIGHSAEAIFGKLGVTRSLLGKFLTEGKALP